MSSGSPVVKYVKNWLPQSLPIIEKTAARNNTGSFLMAGSAKKLERRAHERGVAPVPSALFDG